MKPSDYLNDPRFIEAFETALKGHIDSAYIHIKKPTLVPKSTNPLHYENEVADKAIERMRSGLKVGLQALDIYVQKQKEEKQ